MFTSDWYVCPVLGVSGCRGTAEAPPSVHVTTSQRGYSGLRKPTCSILCHKVYFTIRLLFAFTISIVNVIADLEMIIELFRYKVNTFVLM